MAFSAFIPEIWDAQLLQNFHQQVIAAELADRQYEGALAVGNTVHISTVVDVGITDYAAASRQTSPAAVDLTQLDLVVDQEKSFDFLIDDINRAQAAGSMGAYTTSAAIGMAQDSDTFLLTQWAGAATSVGTTKAATGDAAFDVIRDLRKQLNKQHVPQSDRWLLINAEFEGMLLDAGSKLTTVAYAGTSDALREGLLGRLLNFNVVSTENLPTTLGQQALAVYAPSVAYVSQVQETEAMRDVNSFSDRIRGLHVYGAKVIRPAGLAVFTSSS